MVREIVSTTFKTIIDNKYSFLGISIIPVLIFAITDYGNIFATSASQIIWIALIQLIVYTIYAIGIHRLMLLGKDEVSSLGNVRLKKRELLYLVYGIPIGLLIGLVTAVFIYIPFFGPILALGFVAYFLGRLSLVLPAVAVDNTTSFREAWHLSEDYQGTCMIAVGFIPMLTLLPLQLLPAGKVAILVSSVYTSLIMIFNIGLLSTTFEKLNKSAYEDK